MRRLAAGISGLAAALGTVAVAFAGNGTPINTGSANELTIAVYGDAPYGTTSTDTTELDATPAFIDSINADPKVDLVLHVGDIHSGKQYCTEAYDRTIFDLWTGFKDPLVYTPGDNEWTDCHKVAEGGGPYSATTHQINYVLGPDGNPVDYEGRSGCGTSPLALDLLPIRGKPSAVRKKQVLPGHLCDPAPLDRRQIRRKRDLGRVGHALRRHNLRRLEQRIKTCGTGANRDRRPAHRSRRTHGRRPSAGSITRFPIAKHRCESRRDSSASRHVGSGEAAPRIKRATSLRAKRRAPHARLRQTGIDVERRLACVPSSDNPLSAADPLNYMHPGYDVPNSPSHRRSREHLSARMAGGSRSTCAPTRRAKAPTHSGPSGRA
jgi:hypothetical protein